MRKSFCAAALLALSATPASAAPAANAMTCAMRYAWVGSGFAVDGDCSVLIGTNFGNAHIDASLAVGPELCPLLGLMNGHITGTQFSADFNLTRVGAAAVITLGTSGTTAFGAGVAAFTSPCPNGMSDAMVATFAGNL